MASSEKKNFAVETSVEEYERGMDLLEKCEGHTKREKLKIAFDILERAMHSTEEGISYQSHISAIRDSVDNIVANVHAIVSTSQEAVKQVDVKNNEAIETLNNELKDAIARNTALEQQLNQERNARSEVETERDTIREDITFLRSTSVNNEELISFQRDRIISLEGEIAHLKSQIAYLQEPRE